MVFMNRKQFTCCGVFCAHHASELVGLCQTPKPQLVTVSISFLCVSVVLIVIGNYRD